MLRGGIVLVGIAPMIIGGGLTACSFDHSALTLGDGPTPASIDRRPIDATPPDQAHDSLRPDRLAADTLRPDTLGPDTLRANDASCSVPNTVMPGAASPVTAYRVSPAPSIDGTLQTGEWQSAWFVSLDRCDTAFDFQSGSGGCSPVAGGLSGGTFALAWDAKNFYVAARVSDTNVTPTASSPLAADGIEIYVDGAPNSGNTYDARTHHLVVDAGGAVFSCLGSCSPAGGGVIAASNVTPGTGYTLEVAIPLSYLGVSAATGAQWAFDFGIQDGNGSGAQCEELFYFLTPPIPASCESGGCCSCPATCPGCCYQEHVFCGTDQWGSVLLQ